MRWNFAIWLAALLIGGGSAAIAQDCTTLDPASITYVSKVGPSPGELRTNESVVPGSFRVALLTMDQPRTNGLVLVSFRVQFPAVPAGIVDSATLVLSQSASPTCFDDKPILAEGYCTAAERAENPLRLSVNGGAAATTPFLPPGRQVVELALPTVGVASDGANTVSVSMAERVYSTPGNKSIFQFGGNVRMRVCTSPPTDPIEQLAAQFGVPADLLRALMALLEAQR